ncbi:MAG: Tm-1-like ATP-binding domain-containing protein [Lautropia sp.]|nr:Tm-1-like ATP-binding domain-containing protein [Lautropia sp.]
MQGNVLILGAMDTKGDDFRFVRDILRRARVPTTVMDVGVLGEPKLTPDIGRAEVARAGGADIADFQSGAHKSLAMQVMTQGAAVLTRRLSQAGEVAAVFGMGGTGGTAVATAAMRELPVGVPKIMVSTVGGGDVSAYSGGKDIVFFPSIVDVSGLNRISRMIYANAARAMVGMMKGEAVRTGREEERPLLAASMFGSSTPCVTAVKEALEGEGYEVLVFHATGTGGRTMEDLVEQGMFDGVLDITTTELADNLCGGVMDAGPRRCQAAPNKGVPTVLVPGCVDMVNFWGIDTVPDKYRARHLYRWNPNVTLMRTNVEENREIGRRIAEAANAARGPVAVLIPKRGVSLLDDVSREFHDPEADRACFDAIREGVRADIPVKEVDSHINDPAFAAAVSRQMLQLLRQPECQHPDSP